MSLAIGGSSAPAKPPHGTLWVDVRDYGAKADSGATDNSVPFQAAVDDLASRLLNTNLAKGVVFIPSAAQSYITRKPVWVDHDNIEIRGEGFGSNVYGLAGQPVFIFGLSRVQRGVVNGVSVALQPDATNRPDLFGKLDTSAVAYAGTRWGLRTNGNSFAQFYAGPMSAGAASVTGNQWSDQWGDTSALTVEFCVEPPDGQKLPVNAALCGIGTIFSDPSPFTWSVTSNDQVLVVFRTSDMSSGAGQPVRFFTFSLAGFSAPYEIATQFDLANAACSVFVNRVQVPLTSRGNLGPSDPVPFVPGTGLRFLANEYYPFMIGADGNKGPSNTPTTADLRVYGLRISNTIRYRTNGPGLPQVRADSPGTPLNHAWAYFGTDANTVCYLAGTDNPATAGRIVSVAHGGAVRSAVTAGVLIHSTTAPSANGGNAIRDISLNGPGTYGQVVCLGSVLDFTASNVRAVGGYHGIGSFAIQSSYYIYVEDCQLDGADSGYFGAVQLMVGSRNKFLTSGRATMRHVGCAARWEDTFVAGYSPVCDYILAAHSTDYAGQYYVTNLQVDFEGYTINKAGILCENAPYAPATSLVLKDVFFGTLGASTPIVRLKDMGPVGGVYRRAWASIENLQAFTETYLAAVDVDGPAWHGEMKGVALTGPQFNHRQTWGGATSFVVRDTRYAAPPRASAWYRGAHSLDVRSPADGQYAEWRCLAAGTYGTPTPPAWVGINPLKAAPNGLASYFLNHAYMTAALS